MRFRSRKRYPVRNFYDEGGNLVAWYEINPVGNEPSIIIHSEKYLCMTLNIPRSLIEAPSLAKSFLSKFMPRRLAETVVKYAIKDLKIKTTKNFSLKAYAKWKQLGL